jgi:hypothetical protein
MNKEPLSTEEKFLEVYKMIFNTTEVPNKDSGMDLTETLLDCGYTEFRMPDEDMPLIDACPFYGELNA